MILFSIPPNVAEIRGRIAEMQLELAAHQAAPLSDNEVADRIKAMVASHGERAQQDLILAHLIHGSAPVRIGWPADHEGRSIEPSAFDLMCGLDPKRMRELLKTLAANSEHLRGPSPEERCRRIEELRAALLVAETDEEAAITAAEEIGLHVHRRPDADPAIILGETSC